MKKFLNPAAIFYVLIIVAIVLLIGFASGQTGNKNEEIKTFSSDVEQIDNENIFDNSKIRELFDSLL